MPKSVVAVNVGAGPQIMLHSGAWFDLLNPAGSDFTIGDIAQGLGSICRYAGQCTRFYSVAEHCLHVSSATRHYKLEALLHDAAEAFLGDVTRPLKQLLPEYKLIEASVDAAIVQRFGLDLSCRPKLKAVDLRVLAAEQAQIMPAGTDAWAKRSGISPAPIVVRFLSPEEARDAFLERFYALMCERENKRASSTRASELAA
jgi:hypothetical protein